MSTMKAHRSSTGGAGPRELIQSAATRKIYAVISIKLPLNSQVSYSRLAWSAESTGDFGVIISQLTRYVNHCLHWSHAAVQVWALEGFAL